MARDPRSRHELQRRLEETLGPEAADTLMEALPPHPGNELATIERLDGKIDRFEERLTLRLEATEHKLMATFRGELARTVILSQLTTVLGVATAMIAAAKLL